MGSNITKPKAMPWEDTWRMGHVDGRLKILCALLGKTFDDQITKYTIEKETGLSYTTVHGYIEGKKPSKTQKGFPGFKRMGLVKEKEIGKSRARQPMEAYELTFVGLAEVLSKDPESWELIDEKAAKHVEVFPLFAMWDYFKETKIKGIVTDFLSSCFNSVAGLREREGRFFVKEGWIKKPVPAGTPTFEYYKTNAVLSLLAPYRGVSLAQEEARRLTKAIIDNPVLLKFAKKYAEIWTKNMIDFGEKIASEGRSFLKALEQKNHKFFTQSDVTKADEEFAVKTKALMKEFEKDLLRYWRDKSKKQKGGEKS